MPRKRRRARIPTPTWERPRGTLGRQLFGRSPQVYATIGIIALVVVALGVVGFAYWSDYRVSQGRPDSTAVQIGDTKYTLRYFTERLKTYVQQLGGPANQAAQPSVAIPALAQQLVQEAIVLRFASEMEVSASEDDIKAEIAGRLGVKPGDANYDTLYKDALSRSGMTEEEYRQMIVAAALTKKIQQKLQAEVPASAESIHYRQILVADQAAADDIVQQLQKGADFAQVAADKSLDTTTKDKGGDAGWLPRGTLDKTVEDEFFAVEVGKVQSFPGGGGALVIQMLEKQPDRPIDENQKPRLAARSLQVWVDGKRAQLEVANSMDVTSGDRDKINWAVDRVYKA